MTVHAEIEEIGGELVAIPEGSAFALFTTDGALDPLIGKVRDAVAAFSSDPSTLKGRKAITAMCSRVTKAKTYLESAGAALAAEQKEIPKKIDKARREMKEALDALRDQVRQPLTDWETAEEARIAAHKARIDGMNALRPTHGLSSGEIFALLGKLSAVEVGPHCEEFEAESTRVRMDVMATLQQARETRLKYEADQAELEELRRLKAEREAEERRLAEEKAAAECAEAARRVEEDRQEAAVAKALADAEAARQAEANRERQAQEARERQLRDEVTAAERRAKEAEEVAALAAESERREVEEAKAREEAEQRRRESDREHRAKINQSVIDAFVATGLDKQQSVLALTAIVKRQIPHVSISY